MTLHWLGLSAIMGMFFASQALNADTPSPDYALYAAGKPCTLQEMTAKLAGADVVFLGEEHNDPHAHALELQTLQALFAAHPAMALSLEMFERDAQLPLDEYLKGFITEQQFLACSRPWPNYQTDYRPLIEFCRENHLPVVAANAPRRYVNMVAREGQDALQKLPAASKAYLPRLPYSMRLPAGYEKELDAIFGAPHDEAVQKEDKKTDQAPPSSMPTPEHLKEAQALWDTTMAASIARFVRHHPGVPVLQVNGRMHSDHGWGIADRLHRLNPHLKILIVSMRPEDGYLDPPAASQDTSGDFVALTRPQPDPQK